MAMSIMLVRLIEVRGFIIKDVLAAGLNSCALAGMFALECAKPEGV
jgi:hypothetical protein